jgi:hypothetical protein
VRKGVIARKRERLGHKRKSSKQIRGLMQAAYWCCESSYNSSNHALFYPFIIIVLALRAC